MTLIYCFCVPGELDPEVFGTVADWFGAIGTIGAVIVALWLAKHQTKPNIKVKVNYLVIPGKPMSSTSLEFVAVNVGQSIVQLTYVGIEMPDKKHLPLTFFAQKVLPSILEPSRSLNFVVPKSQFISLLPDEITGPQKLRVFFKDSADNKHIGILKIDVQHSTQMMG